MAFDESTVRLWKKQAQQEQTKFFTNLKKNGNYHELKSPWNSEGKKSDTGKEFDLGRKIGYGFFGPACKPKSKSVFGYDEDQKTHLIEECMEIIKSSKTDVSHKVSLAFVLVSCIDKDGERAILPILRFFNEKENGDEFIDLEGKRYISWDELLSFLTSSNHDYCFPKNGIYRDDEENMEYRYRNPSAPVLILQKKSVFVEEAPDLLQPNEMEPTETDFFRLCSSVAFFFNHFCEEEELWEYIKQAGDKVLKIVKKTLPPEDKLYWEENWAREFKNPKTKACALKCLGEVEAKDFVRRMREAKYNLGFREKGLVNINEQILISPRRYQEIPEKYTRELCELLNTAEREKLRKYSKMKGLNLTFEFDKKEKQNIILQLFKDQNLYRNISEFEKIEINNIVISKNLRESYQLEGLHRAVNVTCRERSEKLIDVSLRLINLQKSRNIEDMYAAIEFTAAYIEKFVKEKLEEYKFQLIETSQKEVNRRLGIGNSEKPKKFFFENEIKKMDESSNLLEMNKNFNDSQSECLELSRRYEWGFHGNSAAAYHYLKHGENEDLTLTEYFEKIEDFFKASRNPAENKEFKTIESTTQEGAVCKILMMGGWNLIIYEKKISTPEGALEPVIILATFHVSTKKTSENIVELMDENIIVKICKNCLLTIFTFFLICYTLIVSFTVFYEYFSLRF